MADDDGYEEIELRKLARTAGEKFGPRYFIEQGRSKSDAVEFWQELAKAGILGLGIPERDGGSGATLSQIAAVIEELYSTGCTTQLGLSSVSGPGLVAEFGNEEQRSILPRFARGEVRICFALTEPDSGSNSFAMGTAAVLEGDEYVVNGQKLYISGADAADYMLLICRTPAEAAVSEKGRDVSIFLVDLNECRPEIRTLKMGLPTPERHCEVFFDDFRIPREALLGEPGDGKAQLFRILNHERVVAAAEAVGLGRYCVASAAEYAKHRVVFNEPIGAYQAVQHPLARSQARLDAARLLTAGAAKAWDRDEEAGALANSAKTMSAEAAWGSADAAMQTFGGSGFTDENGMWAVMLLVRMLRIAPISDELALSYISTNVLGLPRSY